ncbi:response regulator transcription factor [Actinospongicola halichondriae]|uniref:response regulator transcription factor n=1 Tax=Actinospongicola halichondriae TaxID=3236844 RepID=UPI003D47EA8E
MSTGPRLDNTPRGEGRKILIVDDEDYITDLLGTALRFVGFETAIAHNGNDALRSIGDFGPDLVVLDVMMPSPDGFEVCRRMRADGDNTPVIFLTARDAPDDRVAGFLKGGDDYVTKPFGLEEMVARVHAVLRRTGSGDVATNLHEYADLVMDEDAHRVTRHGDAIDLSPTEFRLLRYLLLNADRVLSKAQILDHVWQYDYDGNASVVETYISYLRAKVDAHEPRLIRTVRGVGYTLRDSD